MSQTNDSEEEILIDEFQDDTAGLEKEESTIPEQGLLEDRSDSKSSDDELSQSDQLEEICNSNSKEQPKEQSMGQPMEKYSRI